MMKQKMHGGKCRGMKKMEEGKCGEGKCGEKMKSEDKTNSQARIQTDNGGLSRRFNYALGKIGPSLQFMNNMYVRFGS